MARLCLERLLAMELLLLVEVATAKVAVATAKAAVATAIAAAERAERAERAMRLPAMRMVAAWMVVKGKQA